MLQRTSGCDDLLMVCRDPEMVCSVVELELSLEDLLAHGLRVQHVIRLSHLLDSRELPAELHLAREVQVRARVRFGERHLESELSALANGR